MTQPTTTARPARPGTSERRHGSNSRRAQLLLSPREPVRRRSTCAREHVLGTYLDWRGSRRELVSRPGARASVLVLDRDAATRRDPRLVAHLAADEPATNAELVARRYLEQATRGRYRCRAFTPDDLHTVPFADVLDEALARDGQLPGAPADWPVDRFGRRYSIARRDSRLSIPELRWSRHPDGDLHEAYEPLSVRDVIAALEAYEPVRSLSACAIRRHRCDECVSVASLRAELTRVNESPIVLNRGLREAVLAATENGVLSMSEIATRCGRVKRDRTGNESGETSWLARRLGLLPEGGRDRPTSWVHTDVLALIARDGLGLSPREVELH
jgi:hypothetical protein